MALGQFLNKAVNWISKYLEIGKDKGVNKVLGKPTQNLRRVEAVMIISSQLVNQ